MAQKTIESKLTFVDGKATLKYDAVSTTDDINGCEYYKSKVAEAKELNAKQAELETELADVKKQILQNQSEQLSLQQNGYCPLDYEKTTLVGTLTKKTLTHRPNCRYQS